MMGGRGRQAPQKNWTRQEGSGVKGGCMMMMGNDDLMMEGGDRRTDRDVLISIFLGRESRIYSTYVYGPFIEREITPPFLYYIYIYMYIYILQKKIHIYLYVFLGVGSKSSRGGGRNYQVDTPNADFGRSTRGEVEKGGRREEKKRNNNRGG